MLEQLAQWCEQFSPLVGFESLEPAPGCSATRREDCLYLEVTHLAAYFGDERTLARLVVQSFVQRGYQVRVAIANTLGAAWACAQFAVSSAEVVTVSSAKSGGRAAACDSSFFIVPPEATVEALQPLPLEALRLPQETVSLLQQLGIFQVAHVASLPRTSLLSRFGPALLRRWDQACGQHDEVLLMYRPAPQFRADWALEHPTTDQVILQRVLEELTRRLTRALARRGEGMLECICRLLVSESSTALPLSASPGNPATSPLSLRLGLFQPTASASHLQQLWQMQMQRLVLPAPVQQIALEATLTAPLQRRQQELFADSTRHSTLQLAQLVDRLSSRLGQEQVMRPRLAADAQPEFACHYLPLTGQSGRTGALRTLASRTAAGRRTQGKPTASRTSARTQADRHSSHSDGPWGSAPDTLQRRGSVPQAGRTTRVADPTADAPPPSLVRRRTSSLPATSVRGSRPLHLRSPPLLVSVVAVAPDGPPVRLLWEQRTYPIARYWGPERIETGWWRGQSVRRDYYRVETQSGHWLWLFRCLRQGHWYLHGMFG